MFYPRADLRKRLRERDQVVVLRFVSYLPPARVVAVLLAAFSVAAGGLDVAARRWTDPDIGPGRRDRERLDAAQIFDISDNVTVGSDVAEVLPGALPTDPQASVAHVEKIRRPRSFERFLLGRHHCGRLPAVAALAAVSPEC